MLCYAELETDTNDCYAFYSKRIICQFNDKFFSHFKIACAALNSFIVQDCACTQIISNSRSIILDTHFRNESVFLLVLYLSRDDDVKSVVWRQCAWIKGFMFG